MMKLILLILFGAYGLVCLLAYLFQSRLVFFPDDENAGNPGKVGLDYEDVELINGRGNRLHGWWVPAAGNGYTLLYCHGNAGNITHRIEAIRQFVDVGLSVFIFDYSGYGRSSGSPGEGATYDDAETAWGYLVEEHRLEPDRIILYGRSLGAAVAIDLATEVSAAGLIVESPFTSAVEIGARAYPWLPVRYLARFRYNSIKKVPHIRMPKLFVHSIEDEVVPFGMGRRLYNRAARPKTFVRIRGRHDEMSLVVGSPYYDALTQFLSTLADDRQLKGRF